MININGIHLLLELLGSIPFKNSDVFCNPIQMILSQATNFISIKIIENDT